jgi:hypothetical protein
MAKEAKKVRYRVLAPVFVNGSVIDPGTRKDVYVFAAPGLEGRALELAPETAPAAANGTSKEGGGDKDGKTGPSSL